MYSSMKAAAIATAIVFTSNAYAADPIVIKMMDFMRGGQPFIGLERDGSVPFWPDQALIETRAKSDDSKSLGLISIEIPVLVGATRNGAIVTLGEYKAKCTYGPIWVFEGIDAEEVPFVRVVKALISLTRKDGAEPKNALVCAEIDDEAHFKSVTKFPSNDIQSKSEITKAGRKRAFLTAASGKMVFIY